MKRIVFFIALLLMVTFASRAQSIKGVAILGFNASQVDGDEVFGFKKLGLNAGVGSILPFGEKWSVSIETLFNQKGAYKRFPFEYDTLPKPYYNLRLTYAEVPILLHFTDKNLVTLGMGFSFGRLVKFSEIEHGVKLPWTNATVPYDRSDVNFIIDVRFRAFYKFHFNFRYCYSVDKIRTRVFNNGVSTWERNQYNNLLTFRLLYIFNDKVPSKRKKQ